MLIKFGLEKEIFFFPDNTSNLKYSWVPARPSNVDGVQTYVDNFLKNKFYSVKTHFNTDRKHSFEFNDPADEAYFLLWIGTGEIDI
jgi:hypothetical protein